MPMLQENAPAEISHTPSTPFEQQQRRRMLAALALLLMALILVLIKDRQFWFPSTSNSESEAPEQVPPAASAATIPPKITTPAPPPKPVEQAPVRPKPRRPAVAVVRQPSGTEGADSPVAITATNRAVLPPLEVEVVAGNQHQTINPNNNSVNIEMRAGAAPSQTAAPETQPETPAVASNAAERVQLSPGTAQIVSRPVEPSYPMLAKQMKVQGAVVLEALISETGNIQEIQVLSGPAILSAAAREAVRQWRFKPYFQSGRPVETEARITVNFTISTY